MALRIKKLGPFTVEHPFLLAPMAGITHSPFRRLMQKMGSPVVISELISANGLEHSHELNGNTRTKELFQFHPEERPVGFQIFGEDENLLVKACQFIETKGANFIDLNLGCPVPKIVKKGAGAALCRDPQKLSKILSAMVRSVKIPVTIKIRTGWDSHQKNALEIVKIATDAGISWVAIHGRTREQGYQGEADWEFIGEIKAKSSIPILGNGDVTTPEMAVERLKTYGVDGILIGRGALRNPFIFQQAEAFWLGKNYVPPTFQDFKSLLEMHKQFLEESFHEKLSLLHAKKFLSWYAFGYPDCHEFRKKLFSILEKEILWNEAHSFFERNSQSRDWEFLSQPFLMGGHG